MPETKIYKQLKDNIPTTEIYKFYTSMTTNTVVSFYFIQHLLTQYTFCTH